MKVLSFILLLLAGEIVSRRICVPECPLDFSNQSFTGIVFAGGGASNPSLEICDLLNDFRQENGLVLLSHSIALRYTAETHYVNLVNNNHNYFNQTCNMHSWYPIPSLGVNFCCYPAPNCMENKPRQITVGWRFPYIPAQFNAIENAAYQQTSGTTPASPQEFIEQWKASPGHRAAMLRADLKSCGASLNYVTSSDFFGSRTDSVALLWMGLGMDTNPANLDFPALPDQSGVGNGMTSTPTQFPTPQPVFSPIIPPPPPFTPPPPPPPVTPPPPPVTPPPPTGSVFGSPTCDQLEDYCWRQCGQPSIFYFDCESGLSSGVGLLDYPVQNCMVNHDCNCRIPDFIPTAAKITGQTPPTVCQKYQCRNPWPGVGTINWCRNCLSDCFGEQSNCISQNGLCESASRCGMTAGCRRVTSPPTNRPTRRPTRQPTRIPTRIPTRFPTPMPTPNPTSMPTPNPTHMPTLQPTPNPTVTPGAPSPSPTQFPTDLPTVVPTSVPPTVVPTTVVPTSVQPTPQPTQDKSGGFSVEGVIVGFVVLVVIILGLGVAIAVLVVCFRKKLAEYGLIVGESEELRPETGGIQVSEVYPQYDSVFAGYMDGDSDVEELMSSDRGFVIKQSKFLNTGRRTTRKKINKMQNTIELKNLD